MSHGQDEVSAAMSALDKYRGADNGEVSAALAVVGLSAEGAAKESRIRGSGARIGAVRRPPTGRGIWAGTNVDHPHPDPG